MILADRVANLKPSATLAISALAQELKAKGKTVMSLSIGEPDFPTPEHICRAAAKAIEDGYHRYTPVPGLPELRSAVCAYFTRCYQVTPENDNILVSNGGKHSLYTVIQTVINPGDQVLIPAPYWVSYPPIVELAGGKPTIIPTSASKGFKLTVTDLERNFTPKAKALFLNSPSNPTGATYTAEELDAIAQWAVNNNVLVIADEIYDRLVYAPATPLSLIGWWKKHPENFVIAGGVSKSFAMTGWRVGYTVASVDLTKAMSRLQGQSTSNVCAVAQKAAEEALKSDLAILDPMIQTFERRCNLAYEIISGWKDAICPKPEGAFYIFPDVSAYYNPKWPDSAALCSTLLEEQGVALVPGVAFGDDNCIRISYATSDDVVEKALTLVGKVLLRNRTISK